MGWLGDGGSSDSTTNINRTTTNDEKYYTKDTYNSNKDYQNNRREDYKKLNEDKTDIDTTKSVNEVFTDRAESRDVRNLMDATDINMINQDISNIVIDQTNKVASSCQGGVAQIQSIKLENATGLTNVAVRNIKMKQVAKVDFNCQNMNKLANDIQNKVIATLVNDLANKSDKSMIDKMSAHAATVLQSKGDTTSGATNKTGLTTGTTGSTSTATGTDRGLAASTDTTNETKYGSTVDQTSTASMFKDIKPYEKLENFANITENFYNFFEGPDSSSTTNINETTRNTKDVTDLSDTNINVNERINTEITSDDRNLTEYKEKRKDETNKQTEKYMSSDKYINDQKKLGMNIENVIKNNVKQAFSDEKVSECKSSINQVQEIIFRNLAFDCNSKAARRMGGCGNLVFEDIDFDQSAFLMGNCILGNDTVVKMMNELTGDLGVKVEEAKTNVSQNTMEGTSASTTAAQTAGATTRANETAIGTTSATDNTSQSQDKYAAERINKTENTTESTADVTQTTKSSGIIESTGNAVSKIVDSVGDALGDILGGLSLIYLIPIIGGIVVLIIIFMIIF